MKKILVLVLSALIFISCNHGNNSNEESVKSGFYRDSYTVTVDEESKISLVNVSDEYDFIITNERVCEIVSIEGNTCTLKGIKSGYTVLNAEKKNKTEKKISEDDEEDDDEYIIGDDKYQCMITVKEKNEDKEGGVK